MGLSSDVEPAFIDYGKDIDAILIDLTANELTMPGVGQRDILSRVSCKSAAAAQVVLWVCASPFNDPNFHAVEGAFHSTEIEQMPENGDLDYISVCA